MIAALITAMGLFSLFGHVNKQAVKTVPFTFEASIDPNSQLLGTKKTLFFANWPEVIAIDAGSGKRLWEKTLTSNAAVHRGAIYSQAYNAFPIETSGSIAFCFTYVKPDGTIETEVESRRRKDGALNFIVHVGTTPISSANFNSTSQTNTFMRDPSVRRYFYFNWPNVVALDNHLLIVPDPEVNPELFVLSATTGAVQSKIRPGGAGPKFQPLEKANPICFGACVYARGQLISLADSPFGPPSRIAYLGDRILAQYLGDSFYGAASLSDWQGIALFPWSPTHHGKIEDIWHGAFMRVGPPKGLSPRYGPYLGQQGRNPVVFYVDQHNDINLTKIDDMRNVAQICKLDTNSVWKITAGENGVFLLYGSVANDVFDLNGNKLLSLKTRQSSVSDKLYDHTTLLPCGVAYSNYSRVGTANKFKFEGAVFSFPNAALGK